MQDIESEAGALSVRQEGEKPNVKCKTLSMKREGGKNKRRSCLALCKMSAC